jgi:hypothetical protein
MAGLVPAIHVFLNVMAGLVPAVHVFDFARLQRKTWMRGTSPRMTSEGPAHDE